MTCINSNIGVDGCISVTVGFGGQGGWGVSMKHGVTCINNKAVFDGGVFGGTHARMGWPALITGLVAAWRGGVLEGVVGV